MVASGRVSSSLDSPAHGRQGNTADTLSFDRTVNRLWVNRNAVSEVFITDFRPVDETSFVCAAQLPVYHAYYSDHLIRPARYDLLLLLECCRQAATYGGYLHYNNPKDSVNLVSGFEIEITAPAALLVGTNPGQLTLEVSTTDTVKVGRKRRGAPRILMFLGDVYLGRAAIQVTVVPRSTFRTLRRRQRGGEPPSSGELPETLPESGVDPRRVGRQCPANALLTNESTQQGEIICQLHLPTRNRSILDHEHDHYPAMSLVEAARQTGLLALSRFTGFVDAATQLQATAARATFTRFAELDSPVLVHARLPKAGAPSHDGPLTVATECHQDGEIATARITYTPLCRDEAGADRPTSFHHDSEDDLFGKVC